MTALGVAASNFVCSSNGASGVCQGTTSATQRVFIELQTEINRVGRTFGVTKIATDGKVGPKTLSALLMLVDRLSTKLGASLDKSLDELLVEVEGSPTSPRGIALNAEAITAALKRDGAAPAPATGLMPPAPTGGRRPPAALVPALPTAGNWVNTYGPGGRPLPDNSPGTPYAPPGTPYAPPGTPYAPPAAPTAPQPAHGMPLGLKIGLGAAAVAIVAGVVAVLSKPTARVAGVGCSCHR